MGTPSSLLPRYRPTASQAASTDTLVQSLLDFGGDDKKARKLVRSHVYQVALSQDEGGDEVEVRSWNLWEFAYKREPCPFPTRARGLFTAPKQGAKRPGEDGKGKYRIVARGYDKFFNVGEVAWTKWENIPDHTTGPYYLTLKTNGCIIFISALSPSTLLITSKHAIGSHKMSHPQDEENGYDSEPGDHAEEDLTTDAASSSRKSTFDGLTHAGVGSYWLSRHLSTLPAPFDSRAALARELWDANVTAVAELTDDAFEEHVLPTPSAQVGLNLHGLNRNVPGELETFRPAAVEAFAKRWGMHPTPYRTCDTIEEVKRACREVEEQGWDGTMVEGIVVRASPAEGPVDEEGVVKGAKFWKVKFDEPYLMYREWRELTRRLISERKSLVKEFRSQHPSATRQDEADHLEQELKGTINPSKLRNPQSRGYAKWVLDAMASRDESWFEEWAKGRAIVSTREEYLKSKPADRELEDGVAGLTVAEEKQAYDKVLLVPIAAPGCGKTVLALALTALLGISHTQSDDVTTKKTAAGFVRNVRDLLLRGTSTADGEVDEGPGGRIIFADKNNHLRTHREAMVELVKELGRGVKLAPPSGAAKGKKEGGGAVGEAVKVKVKLVALAWDVAALPQDEFHRLAAARIVSRGANHQTLRPERTAEGVEAHEFILWRFLKELEPFDPALGGKGDAAFDEVIELGVMEDQKDRLRKVVARLRGWVDGVPEFGDPELERALEAVKEYRVERRKDMTLDVKGGPRYFGVALPVDLGSLVSSALDTAGKSVDRRFFDQLVANKRLTAVPHMTLLHQMDVSRPRPDPEGKKTVEEVRREKEDLWRHYRSVAAKTEGGEASIDVVIGPRLVWDGRVMAFEVSSVGPEETVQWKLRKGTAAHVTIGTKSDDVRPVEGKMLLQLVLDAESKGDELAGVHVVDMPVVHVKGVIKGLF